MMQDMPSKSFDRSMNHNYMILSKRDFFGREEARTEDYRVRMLLENRIPGLLPVTHRLVDGENKYYYEINSLQSLDRLLEKREIGYDVLKALLLGCIRLFDKLEDYLLDGSQVIMKAEYIYVNVDKLEPYFVYYPDYSEDVRISFMAFIDELLVKLDHADEQAVLLGYQVYRYTRNPNYVLQEIRHMMEQVVVINTSSSEEVQCEERMEEQCSEKAFDGSFGYQYTDLEEEYEQEDTEEGTGKKKDLIGAILCVFIALSAAAILVGARLLLLFEISANQELYLYGALAMAIVAAGIFVGCLVKKSCYQRRIAELNADTMPNYPMEEFPKEIPIRRPPEMRPTTAEPPVCNDTICLGSGVIEERVLRGRVDGREVNIILNQLPMTVGKLASVADYVINDNTVSKMHARFEERDGRVYLCDLNSTNGTVKNGVMLAMNTPVPLAAGDRLQFGRASFVYC